MAKAGFWLKGARGKLAGASLQKGADGETVMREIVTPKNPKTTAQLIQRTLMATVQKAYGQMKEITDHSFEGIAAGQATMARFLKVNANALRARVEDEVNQGYDLGSIYSFSKLGDAQFVPNDYIIAAGSLPEVEAAIASSTRAAMALTTNTYQGVCDQYGLKRGDQLTFIVINGTTYGNLKFHFVRVILDPTDGGAQAAMSTPFVVNGAINKPSVRNEGEFAALTFEGSKVQFAMGSGAAVIQAAGIIVSRKEGDNWLRSRCQLVIDPTYTAGFFPSLQEAMEGQEGGLGVASDRILNNAGQGSYVGANGEGEYVVAELYGGDPVEVKNTVNATGVSVGADGYYYVNDAQGNKFAIKGDNMRSTAYGKYLKSDGWNATAPTAHADTDLVGQFWMNNTSGAADNDKTAWCIEKGMPASYLFVN